MKCCDEVLSPNPEDDSFPYSRSGISGEKEKSISGLVLFACFFKKLPGTQLYHKGHQQEDPALNQEGHGALQGL